jgi:histone-lysine N-methyltransferase SETMAR
MAPHTLANSEKIQNRKIMATLFWDRKGPLLVNLLPRGDAINAAAYCETLKNLHWAIQNKRRGMLTRGVCLLHDNACPHSARSTQELLQSFKWEVLAHPPHKQELLQSFKWEVLAHPPHSPDLAPSNYHLFSKLKESLAGKSFSDDDEVQDAV